MRGDVPSVVGHGKLNDVSKHREKEMATATADVEDNLEGNHGKQRHLNDRVHIR